MAGDVAEASDITPSGPAQVEDTAASWQIWQNHIIITALMTRCIIDDLQACLNSWHLSLPLLGPCPSRHLGGVSTHQSYRKRWVAFALRKKPPVTKFDFKLELADRMLTEYACICKHPLFVHAQTQY